MFFSMQKNMLISLDLVLSKYVAASKNQITILITVQIIHMNKNPSEDNENDHSIQMYTLGSSRRS